MLRVDPKMVNYAVLLFFGILLGLNRESHSENVTNEATIVEYPCNEQSDANAIRDLMGDKKGRNVDAIIALITNRTNAQRLKIKAAYNGAKGNVDIGDDLYDYALKHDKKKPNAAKNIKELFRTPIEFFVTRIMHSVDNLNVDENAVTILTTCSPQEIQQINEIYPYWSDKGVKAIDDVRRHDAKNAPWYSTSTTMIGSEAELLEGLLGKYGMRSIAKADPKKTVSLQNSIPVPIAHQPDYCGHKYQPDLYNLVTLESIDQIRAVGEKYNQQNRVPIYQFMQDRCLGRMGLWLAKIFGYAMDSHQYFADEIRNWVVQDYKYNSVGASIVIQRCEIDLQSIKVAYKNRYKVEMIEDFNRKFKHDDHNLRLFQALINGNRF